MVSAMVDNYNALINAPENNGKKRKMDDQPVPKMEAHNKTLKEQVLILTKIQENLLNFIGEKLDLSEEDLENIRKVGDISLVPIKRTPRAVPGIFTDEENRKYYINIHGAFVYKRPCGKPRKDKKWCHALGEWVAPGQDISEQSANICHQILTITRFPLLLKKFTKNRIKKRTTRFRMQVIYMKKKYLKQIRMILPMTTSRIQSR